MRTVKYLCIFIGAVTFLLGAALAIPVWLSDSKPVKGYLLQKVGEAIGGSVTVKHLAIQLFASPKIKLKEVTLKDQKEGQLLLRLDEGECELEFLTLLIGDVVINHCTLNEPTITLRQEHDGSWRWLIVPEQEEKAERPLVTFAGLKKLAINNGYITLNDETDSKHPRSLTFFSSRRHDDDGSRTQPY